MSSDETRAGGKKERKAKAAQGGEKAKRKRKAAAPVSGVEKVAPEASAPEQIHEPVVVAEPAAPAVVTAAAPPFSAGTSPVAPAAPAQSAPVSYRTFADAWGNYSRTSLEQTRGYFEKLAGARSLGAAFEVQAEFARQTCETFFAQSQQIGALQGELARQRLKRLESFMEKMTGARDRRS